MFSGADYKFTGKERDVESGLQYFEARYYNSIIGKFLSVDPLYAETDILEKYKYIEFLRNTNMQNIYSYTLNNPQIYIDSSGLDADLILTKKIDEILVAKNLPDENNIYSVSTHIARKGNKVGILVQHLFKDDEVITMKEFAKRLLDENDSYGYGYTKGLDIKLYICSSGLGGEKSIANQLVNEIKKQGGGDIKVTAPDQNIKLMAATRGQAMYNIISSSIGLSVDKSKTTNIIIENSGSWQTFPKK
jgi:RHS repeat-associated protein